MTSSFYPPFHIGGDANHVKYLAEELATLGHEVHVFFSKDAFVVKRRNAARNFESSKGVSVHMHASPLSLTPYAVYLFGNSPNITSEFKNLVRQIKPEIVHHHNVSLLGYGIINRQGSYANIHTAHDYWLICPLNDLRINGTRDCSSHSCVTCALNRKRPPQLWRHSSGFKSIINQLDLTIAPSIYLQQRLFRELNLEPIVIQNFAPLPPNHIQKQDYSDYYLFVGSLEEHKGIMNLLEVYRKSSDKIDAKLVIVGTGSLKPLIKSFIQQYSLGNSILFMGSVNKEELYALYKNARALVVPSIWPENAPLVALEALSVGTPVLSSNAGGLPEIVGKVDKNSLFSNLTELEDLLLNFRKSCTSSGKIKEVYEKNFSPVAFVNNYIAAIDSIGK